MLTACGASGTPAASTSASPQGSAVSPSPSASPSPEPSPSPSPSPAPSSGSTLELRIAGLLVVGFRGAFLEEAPWLRTALETGGLGGVCLFDRDQQTGEARNVRSPAQVTSLVAELRAAAGARPIIVCTDQEGGQVNRLSPAHGFPAAASEAAIGHGTAAAAKTWASGLARTLASVGVDLDLAPVVDLDINPKNPAVGALDRSFSADPDVVVEMATIEIEAMRAAGIRTTLKHFPGLGSATVNTDDGIADITDTWSEIELEPYRRLIAAGDVDVIMAAHIIDRHLDPAYPASLSHAIITGMLRGQLGWDGVVITDDLQAAAIQKTVGVDGAMALALNAGDDLLLLANQQRYDASIVDHAVAVVSAAVADGTVPAATIDQAFARVQALLGVA